MGDGDFVMFFVRRLDNQCPGANRNEFGCSVGNIPNFRCIYLEDSQRGTKVFTLCIFSSPVLNGDHVYAGIYHCNSSQPVFTMAWNMIIISIFHRREKWKTKKIKLCCK